jgi:pyruvate,water dikinase
VRVRIDRESRGERETTRSGFPIEQLVDLGHRVESLFNTPCDIEWAWDGRQVWILQARPITTADSTERAAILREEIEHARKLAAPDVTVWVRQNLADVLPNPTPMTWALVQRMLSGDGGLGRMYRDFGCTPDPALGTIGIYDLIAGRPYLNLSREPRMQYGKLPLGHSFARLKAEPRAALEARASLLQDEVGIGTVPRLPAILWKLRRMNRRIVEHARTFADRFEKEIAPAFLRDCEAEALIDYSAQTTPDLLGRFERWSERVLGEFARHSLKPAALADRALDDWRRAGGAEFANRFAASFLAESPLDPRTDLAAALRSLATGKTDRAEFIAKFGHRGPREMELNQPRYLESAPLPAHAKPQRPRGDAHGEGKFIATSKHVDQLRRFVALRESAKHAFMLGTFRLRRMLLELDSRFCLRGGIFFLTPEELPRLAGGDDLSATIAARRRRWAVLKSLPAPAVLFSDDLEAIGRLSPPTTTVRSIHGVAVSHGVAEGPAVVLTEPTTVESDEPYVLVCPSSDPAWTPLLLGACAVVMETGGVLSHGAIVAREFGLPAVGGVPAATSRFRSGERLHVDAGQGTVTVLDNPMQVEELN